MEQTALESPYNAASSKYVHQDTGHAKSQQFKILSWNAGKINYSVILIGIGNEMTHEIITDDGETQQ